MVAAHALEPGLTLHLLAGTSRLVAASPSRLAKIGALADCLAAGPPQEAGIAVAYLAGLLPQGRIGIRRAALQAASGQPAAAAPQ